VNTLTLLGQAGGFDSVVADSELHDRRQLSRGMSFATYQHSAFGDGFDSARRSRTQLRAGR
jgi:hypothetical protein